MTTPQTTYSYTGDGATSIYAVPFEYRSKADVVVTVDGNSATFSWSSPSAVQISPTPANGAAVVVLRETTKEGLVSFSSGALKSSDLNKSYKQLLYTVQEHDNELEAHEARLDTDETRLAVVEAAIGDGEFWAARPENGVVFLEQLGTTLDGIVDNTAAFTTAINYVRTHGGRITCLPGAKIRLTGPLPAITPSDSANIDIDLNGARVYCEGSANASYLTATGTLGAGLTIAGSVSGGQNFIDLVDASSVTVDEPLLVIWETDNSANQLWSTDTVNRIWSHASTVREVDGNRVYLNVGFPPDMVFGVAQAADLTIQPMTTCRNLVIRNATFDGTRLTIGPTSRMYAIELTTVMNCDVNVNIEHFMGEPDQMSCATGGLLAQYGYGNKLYVNGYRIGSRSAAGAWACHQTHARIGFDIRGDGPFAAQLQYGSYADVDYMIGAAATIRCVKIAGTQVVHADYLEGSNAGNTGICFSWACRDVAVDRAVAIGCGQTPNPGYAEFNGVGVWTSGSTCTVHIASLVAWGSNDYDVQVNESDVVIVSEGRFGDLNKIDQASGAGLVIRNSNAFGDFLGVEDGAGSGPLVRMVRRNRYPTNGGLTGLLSWEATNGGGSNVQFGYDTLLTQTITAGAHVGVRRIGVANGAGGVKSWDFDGDGSLHPEGTGQDLGSSGVPVRALWLAGPYSDDAAAAAAGVGIGAMYRTSSGVIAWRQA
jgi:hypothetical protein